MGTSFAGYVFFLESGGSVLWQVNRVLNWLDEM